MDPDILFYYNPLYNIYKNKKLKEFTIDRKKWMFISQIKESFWVFKITSLFLIEVTLYNNGNLSKTQNYSEIKILKFVQVLNQFKKMRRKLLTFKFYYNC